jgi:hypothetical protein
VGVFKNLSKGISSCFKNPFCGSTPAETISMTATNDAAVVHEIARHFLPEISIG